MSTVILTRIRTAIRAADTQMLKRLAYEVQRSQLGKKSFHGPLLTMLLTLLEDPEVHALSDAGPILAPIEFDADKLTQRQRRAVVETLEHSYPLFADRLTQFYITEFIGRKFADENALWLFKRLALLSDQASRALVAHGFEHLACAQSNAIATPAFAALASLASDSADEVVAETLLSLERIVRARTSFAEDAERIVASFVDDERTEIRDLARSLRAHIALGRASRTSSTRPA